MSSNNSAQKSLRKNSKKFSDDEKAAMKARARELKAEANKAEEESAALEAIAKMQEPDRSMAKRLHTLIKEAGLSAKTWYGMPAYTNKDGKTVCYFRDRQKFKERYSMFGFNDSAKLDDGSMWAIAFALPELTANDEKRLLALVKKAVN